MELPLYPLNHLDGSMEPLGYINVYMTYLTDLFLLQKYIQELAMYTWNHFVDLWIMDTFTIMMMCIHRNSIIKYNEDRITGVHNETFLKCRQKYRSCGYMNMIIRYTDGYIYGSSWNPENST